MDSKHKVERDCQLDRLNAELRIYRITVLILSVILMAGILLFGIIFLEDRHMGLCSGTVIVTGDSDVSMICLQVMVSNISPGVVKWHIGIQFSSKGLGAGTCIYFQFSTLKFSARFQEKTTAITVFWLSGLAIILKHKIPHSFYLHTE